MSVLSGASLMFAGCFFPCGAPHALCAGWFLLLTIPVNSLPFDLLYSPRSILELGGWGGGGGGECPLSIFWYPPIISYPDAGYMPRLSGGVISQTSTHVKGAHSKGSPHTKSCSLLFLKKITIILVNSWCWQPMSSWRYLSSPHERPPHVTPPHHYINIIISTVNYSMSLCCVPWKPNQPKYLTYSIYCQNSCTYHFSSWDARPKAEPNPKILWHCLTQHSPP